MALSPVDKEWLGAKFDNVDIRLSEYNKHLEYHIKRTDTLEQDIKDHKSALRSDYKWIVATMIAFLGLVVGVIKYL